MQALRQHDTVLAMRSFRVCLLLLLPLTFFSLPVPSAHGQRLSAVLPSKFAHTFSIVARDNSTGELGVAVQSHWFAVGQSVPWAEAGVGAVATQSFIDPTYGARGLELMRAGKPADEALMQLLTADPARNVRQVAMIDATGKAAAWTGAKCIPPAGDIVGGKAAGTASTESRKLPVAPQDGVVSIGERFSVQANLMANDRIWPAMAKAFQATQGDLAEQDAGRARRSPGRWRRHPRPAVGSAHRGEGNTVGDSLEGPRV